MSDASFEIAQRLLAEYPERTHRCPPAHMCDGMSGCVNGRTVVNAFGGTAPARFDYCYRGGDNVRLIVYPYPDRPAFGVSVSVPAIMVTLPSVVI